MRPGTPTLSEARSEASAGPRVEPGSVPGRDGAATRESIIRLLPSARSLHGARVLDFDCDGGWALRHFEAEAREAEIWCCEADAAALASLERDLCPPFQCLGREARPPLAAPDGHFQLIWALSAFTRLTEGWAEWLLELDRLLADDGLLLVALRTPGAYEETTATSWDEDRVGMSVLGSDEDGSALVFHSQWWVRAHWGRLFEILRLEESGGRVWALLRKRGVRLSSEELERAERDEPREILALRANVTALRAQQQRIQARNRRELDGQREELGRELMRKAFKIAELEQGTGPPLSVSARTSEEYEATLSWRITKPLRAIGRRMRRV